MNCSKSGNLVCKGLSPKSEDMQAINTLTTRQFEPQELYCFEVLLCDNEVDRDGECFDRETLEELVPLFMGKSGICDHDLKTSNQQARIYATAVEDFPGKTTALGEPYCALMAKAYMVRTESNKDMILEIEAGIKKEVSVGCSVKEKICSICRVSDGGCEHVPGKTYGNQLCCTILHGAADAYEWSFVAVPAQPSAGVVGRKGFEPSEQVVQKLYQASQCGKAISLSGMEVRNLQMMVKNLLSDCEELRAETRREFMKKAFRVLPMDDKTNREISSMLEMMSISQMKILSKMLSPEKEPLMDSQFPVQAAPENVSDKRFMI